METAVTIRPLPAALGPTIPWSLAVDTFLAAKVDSANTARAYRRHLTAAFDRIGRASVCDVSALDLIAYRRDLLADGRSAATHAQAIAALRAFLLWARKDHVRACRLSRETIEDALEMPRATVQRPYSVTTDPELARMLHAAPTPRDRALLAVMAGAGLRVSEAVGLDVSDVREMPENGGGVLCVRAGKGAKDRLAPASLQIMSLIRTYLEATGRTLSDTGPLFRAHDRGLRARTRARLTARAAHAVVREIARLAGIEAKTISPHSLRHTYATRFLRAGGNVAALARILGHSSIRTTQTYLDHLELGELVASVPALPTNF